MFAPGRDMLELEANTDRVAREDYERHGRRAAFSGLRGNGASRDPGQWCEALDRWRRASLKEPSTDLAQPLGTDEGSTYVSDLNRARRDSFVTAANCDRSACSCRPTGHRGRTETVPPNESCGLRAIAHCRPDDSRCPVGRRCRDAGSNCGRSFCDRGRCT